MWRSWRAFSQPSVSLILNDSGKVSFSNETKERVFAAAQALATSPSTSGGWCAGTAT